MLFVLQMIATRHRTKAPLLRRAGLRRASLLRAGSTLALSVALLACGGADDPKNPDGGGTGTGNGTGNGSTATGTGSGSTGTGGSTGGNTGGGTGGSTGIPPIITVDASRPDGISSEGGGLCGTTLTGTVRDLQDTHPDFEKFSGVDDKTLVQAMLGPDQKPLYGGNPTTPASTGKMNFDAWYNDVPGINQALPVSIPLTMGANGTYSFNNDAFFPIDDKGFGNQGRNHNFHFTAEIHTRFIYRGGEVFTFKGDDDIWVFINQRRVINLGGVHNAQTESVNLDARATEIGLTKGGAFTLDLFFAERHTVESHIRIDTTIGSFIDCGTPPPPK